VKILRTILFVVTIISALSACLFQAQATVQGVSVIVSMISFAALLAVLFIGDLSRVQNIISDLRNIFPRW
jgi:hypothetical protein